MIHGVVSNNSNMYCSGKISRRIKFDEFTVDDACVN